jgi:hypothetical protein
LTPLLSDAPLAFRPPTVLAKLPPRSAACPVSLRDLMAAGVATPGPFPLVRAPTAGVARAALVAAGEIGSAIGLELPAGQRPEPWFAAVVRAADQFAPRLPAVLSGMVSLGAGSEDEVERARRETFRLVEAGLTHVVVHLGRVPEGERAAPLARATQAAQEREIGVEVLLPLAGGFPDPAAAATLVAELAESGFVLGAAGARFPLPRGSEEERLQARLATELCSWIEGTPVVRRGPVTPGLLELLAASPISGCEDGGAALAAAKRIANRPAEGGARPLARAGARRPPPGLADLVEALAYEEVAAFLEGLGLAGSAVALGESLLARIEER